jgi:hypothetical protein
VVVAENADEPEPTATAEVPEPTATDEPEPTATDEPEPTATDEPEPTATAEVPEPLIDDVSVSDAYIGPQNTDPLVVTVAGEDLDRFTSALVRREDGSGNARILDVTTSSPAELMLSFASIDDLPEPPDGDATYLIELRGEGVSEEVSFEVRDYLEAKTVEGVLGDYTYTNRVAVEGEDTYTFTRAQPNADSEQGAPLRNGDEVEILRDDEDGWYQVRIRESSTADVIGQVWWIERWLIDNEAVPAEPTAMPQPVAPAPQPVRPQPQPVQPQPQPVQPQPQPVQPAPPPPPPPPANPTPPGF